MRTLFAMFTLLILIAGCASVEPTSQQEREVEAAEPETLKPEWYDPLQTSRADSAAVYGFALASATDSSEAVALAENSAINNLRYEIDYLAENTREYLIENENSEPYSRAAFIINLRNTVRDLPLTGIQTEVDVYRSDNDNYHAYVMASLPKSTLWETMTGRLNDSEFMEAFKNYSAE